MGTWRYTHAMIDLWRAAVLSQFEAGLAMLHGCLRACPDAQWDAPVAKYPLWMVAYHTLCFVDCYLSRGDADFSVRQGTGGPGAGGGRVGGGGLHPRGRAELEEEFPSRRFERDELIEYCAICLGKARAMLGEDTAESLAGPSGFSWLPFSRLELHLYNLRHLMHHTGQLSAAARRAGGEPRWVGAGWKA